MTRAAPPPGPRKPRQDRLIATNREARFHYEILDTWEAGLVLTGSEVKSLRAGGVVLRDAYVRIERGEAWLINCHVNPYSHAGYAQHEPLRPRKLLLHAAEIERMRKAVEQKGLALVALKLQFRGARVKLDVGLGRGKKLHDKRETIRAREEERSARRRVDR